jgi:HlyD family secretion protein
MSLDRHTLDQLKIDRTAAPERKLPVGWMAAVVLVLAILGGLAWWFTRPKPVPVRTMLVQAPAAGAERILLNASGYVTARRGATVSSKVTGKVVEVLVEEGMKVEAGQVLAHIDSSNVEKSLKLAEAQLESARKNLEETQANLDQAEREFRRVSRLATEKIASQSDLDRADAEAKSLAARLERQKADIAVAMSEVAVWRQQLDDTIIRAPFAGVVTSKDSQPGEMISPMSAGGSFTRTGICTIVDMSSLEIEVDVSENYINRVQEGRPVEATLDSYPEWRIPAKVIAIIPTADRQKATVKVRVGFEKLDPRILPDMGVKVAFQNGARSASEAEQASAKASITIPRSAVRQSDGRDVVWIVREGKVERRAITVGANQPGDQVEVSAGLNGGEKVVLEGASNLTEGAPVTEGKQ